MPAKPKTPHLDKLNQLAEARAQAALRVREIEQQQQTAIAGEAALREQKVEAHAQLDDGLATEIKAQIDTAKVDLVDIADRVAGAQRALRRAQVEHDAYGQTNYRALVDERAPGARAIADDIHATIARLIELDRAWYRESSEQSNLRQLLGNPQAALIPDLHVHQMIRDLGRATADGVEAPLPPFRNHTQARAPKPTPTTVDNMIEVVG
jgi:ribosomal protein L24